MPVVPSGAVPDASTTPPPGWAMAAVVWLRKVISERTLGSTASRLTRVRLEAVGANMPVAVGHSHCTRRLAASNPLNRAPTASYTHDAFSTARVPSGDHFTGPRCSARRLARHRTAVPSGDAP
jgi:hypothetical protein